MAFRRAKLGVEVLPGLPIRTYLAGTRVETLIRIPTLSAGRGLAVTIVPYLDRIGLGVVLDRTVPLDAWDVVDCIDPARVELARAACRGRDRERFQHDIA